jgi:AP2 domain/HNH endonuclease
MKIILLTQGKIATVDDDDYERISKHKWYYKGGYAVRSSREDGTLRTIFMHREIMHTPDGMVTDHINGDGLLNRKRNLRVCTHNQNIMNSKKVTSFGGENTSSIFRGVSWNKQNKRWVAYIKIDNRLIYLGVYKNEIKAAESYNKAARKYHGEFSSLNKIAKVQK